MISHLGLDEDEGVAASAAETDDQNLLLGPALNQIDVIFGGHLHIVLNPPKDLPHFDDSGALIGHTVLCHSGAFAKYVGRLDLPSVEEQAAGTARSSRPTPTSWFPSTTALQAPICRACSALPAQDGQFLGLVRWSAAR